MGDVEATIDGALHRPENSCTRGRAHEPGVKVTPESPGSIVELFDVVLVAGYLCRTCVQRVQSQFLQELCTGNDEKFIFFSFFFSNFFSSILFWSFSTIQILFVLGNIDVSSHKCQSELSGSSFWWSFCLLLDQKIQRSIDSYKLQRILMEKYRKIFISLQFCKKSEPLRYFLRIWQLMQESYLPFWPGGVLCSRQRHNWWVQLLLRTWGARGCTRRTRFCLPLCGSTPPWKMFNFRATFKKIRRNEPLIDKPWNKFTFF